MKLINKLLSQKKFIVGSICGAVLATSITYGVSQLSSESVSYTKDNKTITVKQALDDLINTSIVKIDKLEENVNACGKVTRYLADVANVGDYVAYDAGKWNETKEIPSNRDEFGGYTIGNSKNDSIDQCYSDTHKTTLKGWRILSKDTVNKTVTLIHAGIPECYYFGSNSTDSINKLNDRAQKLYVNDTFADSAHSIKLEEIENLNQSDPLRSIGTVYWLANPSGGTGLYYMLADGRPSTASGLNGFRPVIVLKTGILTTGEGQDQFGQKAWKIAY